MSRNKTVLAAAIAVMLYTRPALVAGEKIKGLEVLTRDHTDGPYARAIFAEEEAAERLESGFWVDHPNGLSALDKAIAEAEQKEQEADDRAAEQEEAERLKKEQDKKVDEKAPESTATASEVKDAPKADEGEKAPEASAEAQESTQTEAKADEAPKDGDKVDGAKVNTDKKAKK